jgi:hypothetical protein
LSYSKIQPAIVFPKLDVAKMFLLKHRAGLYLPLSNVGKPKSSENRLSSTRNGASHPPQTERANGLNFAQAYDWNRRMDF